MVLHAVRRAGGLVAVDGQGRGVLTKREREYANKGLEAYE